MGLKELFYNFLGEKLTHNCIDSPIFIVGMGRSGTSVLLQAIGKHPEIIAFPGEAPFITSIGGNAALFDSELNPKNSDYYRASLKFDVHYLYTHLARMGLEIAGGKYYGLREYIKAAWANKRMNKKKHWSAKTFPSEAVANGLLKVYPDCKFIYIVRNGVEVVHSMTKFHGFRDKQFEHHCQRWSDSITEYRYLTQHKNALFVRHEDLVSDPDTFFSTVFNFLELHQATESAAFVKETVVHPLDQQTQNSVEAIEQLKTRDNPFKKWTPDQQQVFISICSEAMNNLGYHID